MQQETSALRTRGYRTANISAQAVVTEYVDLSLSFPSLSVCGAGILWHLGRGILLYHVIVLRKSFRLDVTLVYLL